MRRVTLTYYKANAPKRIKIHLIQKSVGFGGPRAPLLASAPAGIAPGTQSGTQIGFGLAPNRRVEGRVVEDYHGVDFLPFALLLAEFRGGGNGSLGGSTCEGRKTTPE